MQDIAVSLSGVGSIESIDGIYDENGILLENGLTSGADGMLKILYRTGAVSSVDPVLTVGNNSYTLELWYSDLAISAKQVWLNKRPYIAVSVYNLGLVTASTSVSVTIGDNVIRTLETKKLANGEMEYFFIAVNPDLLTEDKTAILSLGIDGEYMLGNNSATVSFATNEDMPTEALIYDVNLDGNINIKDVVRLKKIMAGISAETRESDINFDGELTAMDLATLRKMLITSVFAIF